MQSQNVRPISTYDNLSASNVVQAKETFRATNTKSTDRDTFSNGTRNNSSATEQLEPLAMTLSHGPNTLKQEESQSELNETSHSIAAVKAALNDAKSKFFGINNYETTSHMPAAQMQYYTKPEPKYQNIPQRSPAYISGMQQMNPIEKQHQMLPQPQTQLAELPHILPAEHDMHTMGTTSTPTIQNKSLRYATYEQIPLSDLDAPQSSQAVYMTTTVPQNMKGMKIAGRHTPTRNSLRHSRMIVVNNKNSDTDQEVYTTQIRNLNVSRQLLILQLAVGLLIIGLAIWIFMLSPNASILINPYLSGLALLLSSIAGLILLRRDHRKTYNRPRNNCYRVLLAESYIFAAMALIFCCLALVCAAIEFAELTSTTDACTPTSSLLKYTNCSCPLAEQHDADADADAELPAASIDAQAVKNNSTYHNQNDENCALIQSEWKYLLAFSMALNTLGIISTFLYITLYICCHRRRQYYHTSV